MDEADRRAIGAISPLVHKQLIRPGRPDVDGGITSSSRMPPSGGGVQAMPKQLRPICTRRCEELKTTTSPQAEVSGLSPGRAHVSVPSWPVGDRERALATEAASGSTRRRGPFSVRISPAALGF
jgi:hypothetical protein